jgi:hypothetical protein
VLQNARFAAAVLVEGVKGEERLELRWDVQFPSLYQIRQRGHFSSPIASATAQIAALFVRHFPRELMGVYPPERLPAEVRQKILADVRSRDIRITLRQTRLGRVEEDEAFDD